MDEWTNGTQTKRETDCQMDGWMIGRTTMQWEDAKDDSIDMIVEKP